MMVNNPRPPKKKADRIRITANTVSHQVPCSGSKAIVNTIGALRMNGKARAISFTPFISLSRSVLGAAMFKCMNCSANASFLKKKFLRCWFV